MAHFEIYLESSGNIFAGGADLISISDFLSISQIPKNEL